MPVKKKPKSRPKPPEASPLTRSFRDYIRNRALKTPFGEVTPEDVESTGNYTNFSIGNDFYTGAYSPDRQDYFSLRGWIPYKQEQNLDKEQEGLVRILKQISEGGGIIRHLVIPLFKQVKEDTGIFTVFFEIRGIITQEIITKMGNRELNELVWQDFVGPLVGYFSKQ